MVALTTMPDTGQPPILLTGLPRCGSSWVGQCVSRVDNVRYRYESLNADWVPALRGQLGQFRYHPPELPGPERFRRAADRALSGRQSMRQRARGIYRGYADAVLRRRGRLVLKDPTACLLAGWLAAHYHCHVVILTRHPCGFVHSIQRLGWPIPLDRLLSQRALVRDHLEPHLDTLTACRDDPLAALGAFWAATHLTLQRQAGEEWPFISYERLCLQPEHGFADLSSALGVDIPAPRASETHREDPGSTLKNPRQAATAWRAGLTRDEIARIMAPVDALGLRELAEWGEVETHVDR